jgi:DNA replicative helicase MCM subunit Mcm2 (Cdc46/Mcm family)
MRSGASREDADESLMDGFELAGDEETRILERTHDSRIAGAVLKVCRKNADYCDILKEMVSIEKKAMEKWGTWYSEENSRAPFGWSLSEVGNLTGGHVSHLMQSGIVADPRVKGYKSNRYAYYQLNDLQSTIEGLDRFERMREEEVAEGFLTGMDSKFLDAFEVSEDNVQSFRNILKENDALDYWLEAIAPKIVGMEKQKRAILVSLASTEDRYESKNRIHVLLWGPPETGKSKLAYIVKRLGGGWVGSRSSEVGLTADCSKNEMTLGALPRHNKGAIGVDELDKFGQEQSGCLQSMEEGEVTIDVGKFHETLPAETIVVATSNSLDKLKPELVSRFDFVLETKLPTVQHAVEIAKDGIEWWDRPKGKDVVELGKFLMWVRQFDPEISQQVRDEAKAEVERYIRYSKENRPRVIHSITRVAKAIARLNRRNAVAEDFGRAIGMINGSDQ